MGGSMDRSTLDKQIIIAKENSSYFFSRMVIAIFLTLFKLMFVVVISFFVSHVVVTIVSLLYTIYLLYDIVGKINYYFGIIKDIDYTLSSLNVSFKNNSSKITDLVFSNATK